MKLGLELKPLSRRAKIIGAVIAIPIVLASGWTLLALNWTYSSGERAGYVQKFSLKGWVCKTWEGELAMVAIPGSTPEKFFFTVKDQGVADRINALVGKQ